ncbi:conserved hypothetical protein [Agrobacterium tumefaciens str. B6]|uniref:Uncharacterized protein n=1 Tax=Agrobacterium tumefaciens str. B6 TaxID=1183423 RepID=A0A822VCK9_AGRTU|nr:conserved hypothetical protein [Agrobacterium tumefaciens str. B6]
MHRQLGGDLLVGQIVEQLPDLPLSGGIDEHDLPIAQVGWKSLVCIAAEIRSGRAPDMIELFLSVHGADRAGFTCYYLSAHPVGRLAITQIAVAVEPAGAIIDLQREEYAGDAGGQKLAHGEHVATVKQRREDLEHVVVVGFGYLKPLANILRAVHPVIVERRLTMAIEQGVHFVAAGDTFEHFTDGGRVEHRLLLWGWGPKRKPDRPLFSVL